MTSPFRCLCCGSDQAAPFLSDCADLYLNCPGSFDYAACRECGLVQLYPLPPDLSVFYRGYPSHQPKSIWHEKFRELLMGPGYFLPPPSPALRVLDFGCGDGWFLRRARQRGHTVAGFEPNAGHTVELAATSGIPIFSDAEVLREKHRGSFDLITMHFVMEHLIDLHGTFALAADLLAPNGRLRLIIPNINCCERSIFGRKWHALDPPRHTNFLTDPTLRRMAGNEFELTELKTLSLPNVFAASLATVLAGRYHHGLFLALIPFGWLWAQCVRTEHLAVTFQKRV